MDLVTALDALEAALRSHDPSPDTYPTTVVARARDVVRAYRAEAIVCLTEVVDEPDLRAGLSYPPRTERGT